MGDALSELELRDATLEDAKLLHDWRNDAETRRNSFSTEEISFDSHVEWLKRKLAEPSCAFFVAELDGVPVGQVRVDQEDRDRGEISVVVAPVARGRGIGRRLIAAGSAAGAERLGLTAVVARIKPENASSIGAFRAAGYEPRPGGSDAVAQAFEWRV